MTAESPRSRTDSPPPTDTTGQNSDSAAAIPETPLLTDSVFSGLLSTQFLGAFNDNYFKQMVLLKCTGLAAAGGANLQPLALAAFALPFVLLSGFAGFLSDRYSKRTIIVLCKVGEIAVMALSFLVLLSGASEEAKLAMLIAVLGFMGAQSAFFGPSKYVILPELFPGKRLLPVNGAIQMTTFLAIIFGTAIAGIALDKLEGNLWLCSIGAVGIAAVGTLTSLLVRRTPVARPGLKFEAGNLFVPQDVRSFLLLDRRLLNALLVMTMFWFVGGVAQPAVNNLGELTLHLSRTRTSLLAAAIGVGIATGCVVAGFAGSRSHQSGERWTRRGSWLIIFSLLLITFLGSGLAGRPATSNDLTATPPVAAASNRLRAGEPAVESVYSSLTRANLLEWSLRGSMFLLGFAAGIFVVPLQVFIQQAPPADKKGRMIGTMNLMTWIGILLSAGFLAIAQLLIAWLSSADQDAWHHMTFFALAVLMVPIALFYRLPSAAR
ncbi:MAG: MFS transporter [Fuerstiella sp.]